MRDANQRQSSEAMQASEDVATAAPANAHDGTPAAEDEAGELTPPLLSIFTPLPSALGVTYSFI